VGVNMDNNDGNNTGSATDRGSFSQERDDRVGSTKNRQSPAIEVRANAVVSKGSPQSGSSGISYSALFIVYALCSVVCLLFGLAEYCVLIKRIHVTDINLEWMRGMWIVFAPFIPFLLWSWVMKSRTRPQSTDRKIGKNKKLD
jgi:hypothetical protein